MKKTGIKLNVVGAIIIAALIAVFVIYVQMHKPKYSAAIGIYQNECCGDIIIDKEYLSQNGFHAPYKLVNMKFGLTVYVDRKFTKSVWQASANPTAIIFFSDRGKRAFHLTIDGREYTFREVA